MATISGVGDWSVYSGRGPARVAVYARVSTVEQARGYSLPQQVEELRGYSDRRGGKVVYLVRESESGGSVEGRPRLERLLRLAEAERFDILLVWKIDRLGRTNLDLQNLWAFFKALGIDVVSATEPFDSTTVQGKLLFDMNAMLAEWERGTIRERTAMGARGRAKEGMWHGGLPAHGFVYDPSTGRLRVEPKEREDVLYIVRLALEERDLGAVVQTLRAEGRVTRRGKSWSKPVLSRMIRNPVYTGLIRVKDVVVHDESLRILDDETFSRLQALRVEWGHHRIAAYHRPRDSRVPEREWCRRCGYELAGTRAYCSNCGAAQWLPDEDPEPVPARPAPEQPKPDSVG